MAEFSPFAKLPKELQLQVWEEAIPRSPSVHFLSYPPHRYEWPGTHQWQSELPTANRTINMDKDPDSDEPSMRARTWGRYSSYFARLALLHACQESRRVCLSQNASSYAHGSDSSRIISTSHYTLNMDIDIICIQDSDPCFPLSKPRFLDLSPWLCPLRIALERRPKHTSSDDDFYDDGPDWLMELSGAGLERTCVGTSLGPYGSSWGPYGFDDFGPKVIYLLDYDIKPKPASVAGTPKTPDGRNKTRTEPETESDDYSVVELPGHFLPHNGKFHGHGVTFYALSANIEEESCAGWVIPRESWLFLSTVISQITTYPSGYRVVDNLEEAFDMNEPRVCLEFLACVRA